MRFLFGFRSRNEHPQSPREASPKAEAESRPPSREPREIPAPEKGHALIEQLSGPPIKGVRQAASGLYVPEALSREREVWTQDERRLLDRVGKLTAKRGLMMVLICDECRQPTEKIRRDDGSYTLRCDHRDREMQAR